MLIRLYSNIQHGSYRTTVALFHISHWGELSHFHMYNFLIFIRYAFIAECNIQIIQPYITRYVNGKHALKFYFLNIIDNSTLWAQCSLLIAHSPWKHENSIYYLSNASKYFGTQWMQNVERNRKFMH